MYSPSLTNTPHAGLVLPGLARPCPAYTSEPRSTLVVDKRVDTHSFLNKYQQTDRDFHAFGSNKIYWDRNRFVTLKDQKPFHPRYRPCSRAAASLHEDSETQRRAFRIPGAVPKSKRALMAPVLKFIGSDHHAIYFCTLFFSSSKKEMLLLKGHLLLSRAEDPLDSYLLTYHPIFSVL